MGKLQQLRKSTRLSASHTLPSSGALYQVIIACACCAEGSDLCSYRHIMCIMPKWRRRSSQVGG